MLGTESRIMVVSEFGEREKENCSIDTVSVLPDEKVLEICCRKCAYS